MEELNSPFQCPNTVTVRRNPHRRARATPSTTVTQASAPPSKNLPDISSFPVDEILSIQIAQSHSSGNLKVYLRIRPPMPPKLSNRDSKSSKNVWPKNPAKKHTPKDKIGKNKRNEDCIKVNNLNSVTLSPPSNLQVSKRIKSEVYHGFSCVFTANSSQIEVYERMLSPLVEEFLRGKSGMLAALGPSGSGKTHTIFGSTREPGMVPLALQRIFKESSSESPRSFYLSIFEIYSERGKGEKMLDLSADGAELCLQQSTIKGLKEVIISDPVQAESLIACAIMKRATAMTNSNSQSSRSQCIINIRSIAKDRKDDVQGNNSVLTIVDLAGAEREKRTGNQGARLLESNFINNTSMVFGLCLRSLLEHQKNPKRPMQRHFQNSLLTRYLRDFLEGKKRMTLILTVKSGEEDYLDTSYLLRQASPYMNIKFDEDVSNLAFNKRHVQTSSKIEQHKRMKLSGLEADSIIEEKSIGEKLKLSEKEEKLDIKDGRPVNFDPVGLAKKERNHHITQNFAKALWNVLKRYNEKLKVAESEIQSLRLHLNNEKTRNLELEKELMDFKSYCTSPKESSVEATPAKEDSNIESGIVLEEHKLSEVYETKVNVDFPKLEESICHSTPRSTDSPARQDQDLLPQITVDVHSPNLRIAEGNTIHQHCDFPSREHVDAFSQVRCSNLELFSTSSVSIENFNNQGYQNTPEHNIPAVCCISQTFDITSRNDEDIIDSNYGTIKSNCTKADTTDSVVSSFESLVKVKDTPPPSAELAQSQSGEEESLHSSLSPKMVASIQEFNVACVLNSKSNLDTSHKPLDREKPKRRLLPASSILVRDMKALGIEDELEKPRGNRKGKKLEANEGKRTQGSITLLRLLKNNLKS